MKNKLTTEQLAAQTENIFKFLQLVHPELIRTKEGLKLPYGVGQRDLAVELRPLKRGVKIPFTFNHRLYNFGEKQKEALKKFLERINKENYDFCCYYSVYSFNSTKMAVSQSGKVSKAWNNKVCLKNAIGTSILIADYDDITKEEFKKYKQIFLDLGIETLDIFSGHGYQQIILLDNYVTDLELLKEYTNFLYKKGFPVDLKIKDPARIMRLPYTYNCKDPNNIIKTYISSFTEKRYKLEDIFNRLDTLPNVKLLDVAEEIKVTKKTKKTTNNNKEVDTSILINNTVKTKFVKEPLTDIELQELYPMLNIPETENAIKLMLSGFQKGYANNVLMFLTLYYKEQGFTKGLIISIINILKELDTYKYAWPDLNVKSEVDRFYFAKDYTSKAVFFGELRGKFGYIEYSFSDKSNFIINNYIFNNLDKISTKAFLIYIKLLIFSNKTGRITFKLEELEEITGIPKRTVQQHLQDLVKIRVLDKKRANRRKGETYTYFISQFISNNYGFTKVNVNSILRLIDLIDSKKLNPTQFTLCLYLKFRCYGNTDSCFLAQITLGDALNLTQGAISLAFKNLEGLELIKREAEYVTDFSFKYNYSIFY